MTDEQALDEPTPDWQASVEDELEYDDTQPLVLILGRDTCEDTTRSREYLLLHGVPFVYRNIDLDPEAEALNRSYNGGEIVTPVILVGDPSAPTSVLIEPSDDELGEAVRGR